MPKEELVVEVAPAVPAQGDKPAKGPVYRNVLAKDGYCKTPGVSNLYEVFCRSVKRYRDKEFLGWRPKSEGQAAPFKWLTFAEVSERVDQAAGGFAKSGLTQNGRCAIFSANSPEWMITMQACNRQGILCVPLYDTLGENAVEYIINHSESTIVFVSAANFPKFVRALPKAKERLKTLVYWGLEDEASAKSCREEGLEVYKWDQFLELGKANPAAAASPGLKDSCTIMYTSGTTSDPKGVLITHEAVMATVAAVDPYLSQAGIGTVGPGDSILSYLPLAHIFERVAEEMMLSKGGKIGYYQGDVKLLVDDIAALRPTIFVGVPRVFDRIHSGIASKVAASGGLKKRLFDLGMARKRHFLQQGVPLAKASPFFDALVFKKVKQRMGGRVRAIVSGAAPLARHVEDFLTIAMCCPVVQGYGLTESCAASFIGLPGRPDQAGTVGPPLPSHSIRLEGVPDMNYDPLASPPRGEVCIQGPVVFAGYYKDEEKTREVLEDDGWFHTGDVGELTPSGALRIIDRKKNIFKLAQGEYIAVENIETVYKKLGLVEQIWVYGNSYESTLVAVVVPEAGGLQAWARQAGVSGDHAALCSNPQTKSHLLAELNKTGKASKLKGFEMLKDIKVESKPFSLEDDLLTPTFKLKRPQLQKRYQTDIDALYKSINSKSQS